MLRVVPFARRGTGSEVLRVFFTSATVVFHVLSPVWPRNSEYYGTRSESGGFGETYLSGQDVYDPSVTVPLLGVGRPIPTPSVVTG